MELIWLVLSVLILNLAALRFAVDTRPGFEHAPRWRDRHPRPTARSLSG
jgi:hypothetical protein